MKKYIQPSLHFINVIMSENIASSSSSGTCPFSASYSPGKQQCINCRLYYNKKGQLPYGIDCSGGIETFYTNHGLGFSSKAEAEAFAASLSCPVGLG